MLKQLLISGVLLVSAVPPAFAGPTSFWGTSQVPNVACNIWGCPNAPLGAECTINGCPPSPPVPPAPSPTFILVPGNTGNNSSSNNGMGDCMERLMYREIRAFGGPYDGDYLFSQPQGATRSDMLAAGLAPYRSSWESKQPVVKVQVMDGRVAAASCR